VAEKREGNGLEGSLGREWREEGRKYEHPIAYTAAQTFSVSLSVCLSVFLYSPLC